MDRMIYTAMTGAKHILKQQETMANNLANATSTGFKSQIDSFRAVPVISDGLPTRAFVVDNTVGTNFDAGVVQTTGRTLDVAIQSQGWFAVQRADGSEGYTRNGSMQINENGLLQTSSGLLVLGDGGPISIPPDTTIGIAKDGTVSAITDGAVPGPTNVLGRFKLVNPETDNLTRGDDGLFITKDGQPADVDANVTVISGALESSNVNVADAMVNMITLARQFEMNMKILENAENNANKASQLLSLT